MKPLRSHTERPKTVIVGAGVIGLGIAWRLAALGAQVSVFDKGAAGAGASQRAARMLAAFGLAPAQPAGPVAPGPLAQARRAGLAPSVARSDPGARYAR